MKIIQIRGFESARLGGFELESLYTERDSRVGVGQGSSLNFLTETRDIARGKARVEGKKFEEKLTLSNPNLESRAV